MNIITLPWPHRDLHPNTRCHWSKRSRATKAAKATAHLLALEAGARVDWDGRIHVWITGYPPDRRRRDHDGFLSSLKASLDGLADALGVDDRRFVPHPDLHDEVRKGGEVRVALTQGPES